MLQELVLLAAAAPALRNNCDNSGAVLVAALVVAALALTLAISMMAFRGGVGAPLQQPKAPTPTPKPRKTQQTLFSFTTAGRGEAPQFATEGGFFKCMYGSCTYTSNSTQGMASHKQKHVRAQNKMRTTLKPKYSGPKNVQLAPGQKSQTATLAEADDARRNGKQPVRVVQTEVCARSASAARFLFGPYLLFLFFGCGAGTLK
jgi:hypothetical protein